MNTNSSANRSTDSSGHSSSMNTGTFDESHNSSDNSTIIIPKRVNNNTTGSHNNNNNNDQQQRRGYHIQDDDFNHDDHYDIGVKQRLSRRDNNDEWNRRNKKSRRREKASQQHEVDKFYGPHVSNRIPLSNDDTLFINGNDNYHMDRSCDGWKCSECTSWNEGDNHECYRCHTNHHTMPRGGGGGGSRGERSNTGSTDYYLHHHHYQSRNRSYSYDNSMVRSDRSIMSDNHYPATAVTAQVLDSNSCNNTTTTEERDEFGRIKSKQPKSIRWPPCFESNGSAFVLDTRSGMFYESISDFFYDPQSKLYYGNKQGAYFQYDTMTRKFSIVSEKPTAKTIESNDDVNVDSLLESSSTVLTTTETKKPSITINLKTKTLASSKATTSKKCKKDDGTSAGTTKDKSTVAVESVTVVPKHHAMNIEKWSERQIEIRQQQEKEVDISQRIGNDDNNSPKVVAATAKGEPICLLCRRRFPNLDKLRHHEEVSNLHKDNLAKQAAAAAAALSTTTTTTMVKADTLNNAIISLPTSASAASTSSTYVDRAQQRRQLHDVETTTINANTLLRTLQDSNNVHSIINSTDTKTPPNRISSSSGSAGAIKTNTFTNNHNNHHHTLDESNIGHQMLQKLGWKSGNVLGAAKKMDRSSMDTTLTNPTRTVEDNTNTNTIIPSSLSGSSSLSTTRMEQDWDRIEAVTAKLASSSSSHRGAYNHGTFIQKNSDKKGIGH